MGARSISAILLAAAVLLGGGAEQAHAAKPRPPALRLLAVSPKGEAPGDATIELRFSAPVAAIDRADPAQAVATDCRIAWSQPNPTTLSFTPSDGYLPGTVVHITDPEGAGGH